MNKNKAYPYNPHHDWYSPNYGWEYLGILQTDINGCGVLDLYVNHKKQWVSYVFGNNGWDYYSGSYTDLFSEGKSHDWMLKESSLKTIHREFLKRCGDRRYV